MDMEESAGLRTLKDDVLARLRARLPDPDPMLKADSKGSCDTLLIMQKGQLSLKAP